MEQQLEKITITESAQVSTESLEKEEPKLSKNQIKKQVKQLLWLEKREQLKLKEKKEKNWKKSKTSHAHIRRFDNKDEEGEVKQKLTKQEKLKMFEDLCKEGPKFIIDCEFESLMNDRDLKSLGQQLAYCHSINKKQSVPINIFMSGVEQRLQTILQTQNCQHWAIQILYNQSYIDTFSADKERLVYLTADSENILSDFNPASIYIIGGIVDHNNHKLLTYKKALSQNIQHARLPIRENVSLESSAVLTVNHVFDVIAHYLNTKDWKVTMETAIPKRKRKAETGEDQQSKKVKKDQEKDELEEKKKLDGMGMKDVEEEKINEEEAKQ